ncbi:DUF952 domain-containing protein [Pleurocapsales cyanobacterium LEGE 10410]|nr:DUF952 domain-containing protein [Pleurocapsales cyanobacterium LEGE 10410]
MSRLIYHITSSFEWNAAQTKGEYQPAAFAREQFIHCSYRHQLLTVAHRFYFGQSGLVILVIESSKINSSLIEENLEGGVELYPHLYGVLPIDAVYRAIAFPCNADGSFNLPEELKD